MPSGVTTEVHSKEPGNRMHSSRKIPSYDDSSSLERKQSKDDSHQSSDRDISRDAEEGVEVVLGNRGMSEVVEAADRKRSPHDQSIFRQPHPVRPRAMHAPTAPRHHPHPPHPHHPPPPPPHYPHHYPYGPHASGSWGYGPPPPPPLPPHHGEYLPPPHHHAPPPPPRPYPVPPYTSSGSFDDQGSYHHHTPHYSPHIQYPPPGGRYPGEDVNVISPNHKGDPHYRPPLTPRPRHLPPTHQSQQYYHYPPTSPVSRPVGPQPSAPPRLRNYSMRRSEGSYTRTPRSEHYRPEDPAWSGYPPHPSEPKEGHSHTPVVGESFDSEHQSQRSTHPATTGVPPLPPPPPPSHDPHYQFYGGGGSWGSFDSASAPPPPLDDHRYHAAFPPDSPYSPYAGVPPFSPGGIYPTDSFPPPPGYGPPTPLAPPSGSFSYSYDEEERLLKDYHPDRDGEDAAKHVTPPGARGKGRSKTGTPISSNVSNSRNLILPKAAEEIDFAVTDPPLEPILPPSEEPVCESLAEVNSYDVLCGRGGGTNSQIGNRRFRKLVQEFQPTYLMAKRKEKPLMARTIVLIIRKRGGRFLKKNEDTGELFEVGDTKAEAKTSQALREGLDVRATKSAANSLVDKKKKKKSGGKSLADEDEEDEEDSPKSTRSTKNEPNSRPPESPPTLPRLQGEEVKAGSVHPHSPEQAAFRKRRRMRSNDRFFPDFCPPRAELGRPASPDPDDDDDDGVLDMATTPIRRNHSRDDDVVQNNRCFDHESVPAQGCAGIALDLVTGAAAGSFCLGPTGWRR